METLTVKQAIEKGFEYFVYAKEGYQAAQKLGVDEIDWSREDIYLLDKNGNPPHTLSSKEIAETLADAISENHSWDTGDDTDDVYQTICDLDFTDVEQRIKEALSSMIFYPQTNIRLINL